jgi:hypothetical protein
MIISEALFILHYIGLGLKESMVVGGGDLTRGEAADYDRLSNVLASELEQAGGWIK